MESSIVLEQELVPVLHSTRNFPFDNSPCYIWEIKGCFTSSTKHWFLSFLNVVCNISML